MMASGPVKPPIGATYDLADSGRPWPTSRTAARSASPSSGSDPERRPPACPPTTRDRPRPRGGGRAARDRPRGVLRSTGGGHDPGRLVPRPPDPVRPTCSVLAEAGRRRLPAAHRVGRQDRSCRGSTWAAGATPGSGRVSCRELRAGRSTGPGSPRWDGWASAWYGSIPSTRRPSTRNWPAVQPGEPGPAVVPDAGHLPARRVVRREAGETSTTTAVTTAFRRGDQATPPPPCWGICRASLHTGAGRPAPGTPMSHRGRPGWIVGVEFDPYATAACGPAGTPPRRAVRPGRVLPQRRRGHPRPNGGSPPRMNELAGRGTRSTA